MPDHVVFIGDNNTGKSTVLEAIDLALGPDRLNRRPPVDEHDFYQGNYLAPLEKEADGKAEATEAPPGNEEAAEASDPDKNPKIEVEVLITKLSDEQRAYFVGHIEWWSETANALYDTPKPEGVDQAAITAALRVTFIGHYDNDEDDFKGTTYYSRSLAEGDDPDIFHKKDKQKCGCSAQMRMSPLCPFGMTLPERSSGGVWGDGPDHERQRTGAAGCAARSRSPATDGERRG